MKEKEMDEQPTFTLKSIRFPDLFARFGKLFDREDLATRLTGTINGKDAAEFVMGIINDIRTAANHMGWDLHEEKEIEGWIAGQESMRIEL